jgi:hypothetical protein
MLEWIAIGLLVVNVVIAVWRVQRLERRLDEFAGVGTRGTHKWAGAAATRGTREWADAVARQGDEDA